MKEYQWLGMPMLKKQANNQFGPGYAGKHENSRYRHEREGFGNPQQNSRGPATIDHSELSKEGIKDPPGRILAQLRSFRLPLKETADLL